MKKIELTVAQIAERIGITTDAARQRLRRNGFEPSRHIGANNLYELSDKDLEFLKQANKMGQPGHRKKKKKSDPKPKTKKASDKKE